VTIDEGATKPVESEQRDFDAVVVGAGFAGLYMLHRLRELGLSARVYEKGDDVGGAWYWNQYPGARCDSDSHLYCYSFSDELLNEWEWTERFPEQSEILNYLRFVAERLDLRPDISFNTEVTSAVFDDETNRWEVVFDDGSSVETRFLISAVGPLSEPFIPDFDGLEQYDGDWYHTGRWPHDPVDFSGRRVGVIGTGSSGSQFISEVAGQPETLFVFQRTPNYIVPAQNRPLDDERYEEIKENYDEIWEEARNSSGGLGIGHEYPSIEGLSEAEIESALEKRWQQGGNYFKRTFGDVYTNEEANERICEFIRSKIRELVDDPDVADKLSPTEYPFGAKRIPRGYNGYYQTYNRDDVTLVDVDENPIEKITTSGIRTASSHYELDSIVFATGFDAMTGAISSIDIRGRDAISIEEKWRDGPETYLGLSSHGFPNLFMIAGPQSPSVSVNMPLSIEHHVEYVVEIIEYISDNSIQCLEPTKRAEDEWVDHVNELAENTIFQEAESWYRGSNIPGKPENMLLYLDGFVNYKEICAEVAENSFEGFQMRSSSS
jgi:cation diffusion facilitator CzcD-associated flavoprotein CzcO